MRVIPDTPRAAVLGRAIIGLIGTAVVVVAIPLFWELFLLEQQGIDTRIGFAAPLLLPMSCLAFGYASAAVILLPDANISRVARAAVWGLWVADILLMVLTPQGMILSLAGVVAVVVKRKKRSNTALHATR